MRTLRNTAIRRTFILFLPLLCLPILFSPTASAAVLGDADGDGEITPADARAALRVAVQLDRPDERAGDMDVDGDGKITPDDARFILRRAVWLDCLFPVEAPYPAPADGGPLAVTVDAPFALVYAEDENLLLYRQNIYEPTAPASLLKLLTALTALRWCEPTQLFAVGDEIDMIAEDSSVCGLEKGWQLPLEHLLCGAMLCSGNDAAYCIAVNVARTVADVGSDAQAVACFVGLMNRTARELGMASTVAMTPDGYDAPGQRSTPADLLTLARAALDNRLLADICSRPSFSFSLPDKTEIVWKSTNRYLNQNDRFYDPHVDGLKGGFTDDAGCCLISSWQIAGKRYIAIVMGLDSFNARYHLSSVLMNAVAPGSVTVQPENPEENGPADEEKPTEKPSETYFPAG